MFVRAECFANKAFDPVPFDRIPISSADHQTQPRAVILKGFHGPRKTPHQQLRRHRPFSVFKHCAEIPSKMDSVSPAERQPFHNGSGEAENTPCSLLVLG